MLKQTKPLKAKKQLRVSTALKSRSKLAKKSKRTIPQLRDKADKLKSRAVRLRDSELVDGEWIGSCITHDKTGLVAYKDETGKLRFTKGWDNGHFIGRGDYNLRYDDENNNLQCAHCNAWRDKEDMLEGYRRALELKYGTGTVKRLKYEAKHNRRASLTRPELEQIIQDSLQEINFYESMSVLN